MSLAKVRIPWPNRGAGASRRRLAPVATGALLSFGLAALASAVVIYWQTRSTDWQPDASAASMTDQYSSEARLPNQTLEAANSIQGQALSRLSLSPEIPGTHSDAPVDGTADEVADGLKSAPPHGELSASIESSGVKADAKNHLPSTDPAPAGLSPRSAAPPDPPPAVTGTPKPPVEKSQQASLPADPPTATSQTPGPVEDSQQAVLTADRSADTHSPAASREDVVYPVNGLEPDQGAEPGLELAALARPGSIEAPPVQSNTEAVVATLPAPPNPAPPDDPVGAGAPGPIDGRVLAVQVASMRTKKAAEREWTRLQNKFPDLLGEREMSVEQADLGDRGTFFRVRTGPLESVYAAVRLCEDLKRREQDCFVAQR